MRPPAGPTQPGLELSEVTGANVVIVTFDALRADALGVYGYDQPTSPNIDRFAQQALVFERAYSAAPVTPTSFAAALTGKLPHRVFRGWQFEGEPNLAQVFSESGYTTAAFWNNAQLTEERGFGSDFKTYRAFGSVPDQEVLNAALQWLEEHGGKRFLLWIHFLSPHSPYDYREMARHFYDPSYQGAYERTTTGRFETDDPKEIRRIRSLYDGEVLLADHLFDEVERALRNRDLLESTYLLLSSDHGEEFKERGGFQHKWLHEETVRVPLLLRHPAGDGAGQRTKTLYSHVDLLPTLCALTGITFDQPVDGANLLGLLPSNRAIVVEAMTDSDYRGVGIRTKDHRLILNCKPTLEVELYDLGRDPGEKENQATRSRELRRELVNWLQQVFQGDPCGQLEGAIRGVEPTEGLDDETIRALKSLGYLQ